MANGAKPVRAAEPGVPTATSPGNVQAGKPETREGMICMGYELRTNVVDPYRNTFSNLVERFGD